jgi:hypothetical protein
MYFNIFLVSFLEVSYRLKVIGDNRVYGIKEHRILQVIPLFV